MPSLLAIHTSPRGDYSVSNHLTNEFVQAWKKSHADGQVVTRDLQKTELPFVDVPWIAGAYTPAEQHSPESQKALAIGNELIAELMAADHIVLGTSMYNFSVPAILKAYIDHICRVNVTFTPQYEGLVKGKKVTVIIASGGSYAPGSPTEGYNAETPYLKSVLGFIGMTDINFVMAGGTAAVSMGKSTMEELIGQYKPAIDAAAA